LTPIFFAGGNAFAGLSPLFIRLEQELSDPTGSQRLDKIKEGAVLESSTAATVRLAASEKLADV